MYVRGSFRVISFKLLKMMKIYLYFDFDLTLNLLSSPIGERAIFFLEVNIQHVFDSYDNRMCS